MLSCVWQELSFLLRDNPLLIESIWSPSPLFSSVNREVSDGGTRSGQSARRTGMQIKQPPHPLLHPGPRDILQTVGKALLECVWHWQTTRMLGFSQTCFSNQTEPTGTCHVPAETWHSERLPSPGPQSVRRRVRPSHRSLSCSGSRAKPRLPFGTSCSASVGSLAWPLR